VKVFLSLCCCAFAYAQENLGELLTDRPGFTSPSGVVGSGVLQFETGFTFELASHDGTRSQTLSGPQELIRFGLTDALEVRVASDVYLWQSLRSGTVNGSAQGPSDSIVSAKLRVLRQHALLPELSITGGISLPSTGSPFTSAGRDPSFSLAAVKDLPHGFSLAANENIASITDGSGRFCSTGQSLWIAHPLRVVSLYVEVFRTTISRTEGSATAFDAGLFRTIGRNIQVDVDAGHTIAGERPSWFATVGVVYRAPRRLFHRG
jgi:hypothetical protein